MRRAKALCLMLATLLMAGAPDASAAGPDMQQLVLRDGSRLAYYRYDSPAPRDAAPIVVLHGGPGVPPLQASFDFYGRLANDGHAVYVYDQIGVGQSSRLDDVSGYTLQRNIDDLEALRAHIGAPHLILIGQSWGAVLAAYYLSQHPDAVDRMVLISPGPLRSDDRFASDYRRTAAKTNGFPISLMVADVLSRVNLRVATALFGQAALGRAYDAFWADPRSADALNCPGYRPVPALWVRGAGSNYAALLMTNASLAEAPAPALRGTRVPALILHAECDFIPRAVAEDYAAALPNARIVDIAGAGHAATDAKPDEIAALLSAFLREN